MERIKKFLILEFYIKENDIIKKGDKLFKYKHVGDEIIRFFSQLKKERLKIFELKKICKQYRDN